MAKFPIIRLDKDRKRLFENLLSLSLLRGANYLLPLITLPYLLRVLGPEKYGIVVFAQAFIQYFVIFTDFGFDLSATREISIHRENKQRVNQIFTAVMLIKSVLMGISLGLLLLLISSFSKFSTYQIIYLYAFGIVAGNVMFPVWFFQGMERMKYITMLNITAKLIFTILIFVVIRRADDFLFVPLVNSLGFIIAGIIALWIIFRQFGVRLTRISTRVLLYHLKDSFHFFVSRFSLSLYTITNTFVLGIFTNDTLVGYYGAADKIIKALESLLHPAAQAFYPYMSKQRDIPLFKRVYKWVAGASLLVFLIILFQGDTITRLIGGNQYQETIFILKLFAAEIPIVYMSTFLGLPLLAALGYKTWFNYSVISASLIHILFVGILSGIFYSIQFEPHLYVTLLVITTIFTEFLILVFRGYPVIKFRLLKEKSGE